MEERTTHVRLSADEHGEVETRRLDVVSETTPDGPYSLLTIHVELPDEADEPPAA